MEVLCAKYEALIRQERPECLLGISDGEDRFKELTNFAVANNLFIFGNDPRYGEPINIEYLEKQSEQGLSAIINDGKLLGFRKENP